ncbi:MAG: hypothetical protein WDN00_04045 [Limisphaerales bacterium]
MKRLIILLCILGIVIILGAMLLPSLMRVPPPEEIVPVVTKQELAFFYLSYEKYKQGHADRPAASLSELVTNEYYLEGVVEPHRTRIFSQLEYPIVAHPTLKVPALTIAAYHVAGFGDFFLLTNGYVIEMRLPDYTAASYKKAQRAQMEAIKNQLAEAGKGGPFKLSDTNALR